jgi:hypothetical protein
MKALSVSVKSCEVSCKKPFVYAVYSDDLRVVYIGETFSYMGALGRLAQHLGRGEHATFRKRVCTVFSYEEVELLDIKLFAIPLKPVKLFSLGDYRRAVEYSVQLEVLDYFTKRNGPKIISRVKSNGYCSDHRVKKEAKKVVSEIVKRVNGWQTTS